jgi:hypothetical protein
MLRCCVRYSHVPASPSLDLVPLVHLQIAGVIGEIRQYQFVEYDELQLDPEMHAFVLSLDPIDDEQAYTLSMKVEPRNTSEAIEKMLAQEEQLRKEIQLLQVGGVLWVSFSPRDIAVRTHTIFLTHSCVLSGGVSMLCFHLGSKRLVGEQSEPAGEHLRFTGQDLPQESTHQFADQEASGRRFFVDIVFPCYLITSLSIASHLTPSARITSHHIVSSLLSSPSQ